MTRVDFYHLQTQTLDNVLPKLVERAYDTGKKIKIKIGKEENIEKLNSLLWTYQEQSFLPHGSKKDGFSEMQPIFLSSDEENPNKSEILFLTDGAICELEEGTAYDRILNIFDGNSPEALETARNFWKLLKSHNLELFYWQQDSNGKWVQK
ncbi:MAG: DNA polymerase III subunit chi [Alphaproteobacteria bacterium]|nr:DNA polymerase III subunit chi [Alphaproteobacteria bacterium]